MISLDDLKTTTENTYAKKTDLSSYALASTLNNYYTKSEVEAYVANNGNASSSNTLTTSYGKVNLDTQATYSGRMIVQTFGNNTNILKKDGKWNLLIFAGSSPTATTCLGFYGGYNSQSDYIVDTYGQYQGTTYNRASTSHTYAMISDSQTGTASISQYALCSSVTYYSGSSLTVVGTQTGDGATYTICELL